jgi:hypothetical protein
MAVTRSLSCLIIAGERSERASFVPNVPQQRPRATGVKCEPDGLAGSAACGCC